MNKTFIETVRFTEWVRDSLNDDALANLQRELLDDPDRGSVMPGCGGLRKIRVADPGHGKGKRGGARVIYLHVSEANVIFLMDIYDKNERDDLTPDQKKVLKDLAQRFKLATLQAARAYNKETS